MVFQGNEMCGRNLVDEMKELGKLRTAVMMEKCLRRNDIVFCPTPRKQSARSSGGPNEMRAVEDLSNILTSKKSICHKGINHHSVIMASPPFYLGSPPIRSGNPLIHDVHFSEQRPARQPVLSANRTKQRILSMA